MQKLCPTLNKAMVVMALEKKQFIAASSNLFKGSNCGHV